MDEGVSIFLCGDVMTGRGIDQLLPSRSVPHIFEPYVSDARVYLQLAERVNGAIEKPVPYSYIWGDALQVLRQKKPDLRIVNLETSITSSEEYWEGKGINYRMHPLNIPCLTVAEIDACALANNHVLDWGYQGLAETIAVLEKAGIQRAGAGADEAESCSPARLEVPGKGAVLLYSFGLPSSGIPFEWEAGRKRAGVALLPDLSSGSVATIASRIAATRKNGERVVVSLHWGANWDFEISERERVFAHRLIEEAGADIVYGHSSHHVKAIEVYRGKLILYGCGDFLNDYEGIRGHEEYRGELGLMYFADLSAADGMLQKLEMVPTRLKQLKVTHASSPDAAWLKETLNREGKRLGSFVESTEEGTLLLRWR